MKKVSIILLLLVFSISFTFGFVVENETDPDNIEIIHSSDNFWTVPNNGEIYLTNLRDNPDATVVIETFDGNKRVIGMVDFEAKYAPIGYEYACTADGNKNCKCIQRDASTCTTCSPFGVCFKQDKFAVVAGDKIKDFGKNVVVHYSTSIFLYGDIDGDGDADTWDAFLIAHYLAGERELSEEQLAAADVNSDGVVTLEDSSLIQHYVVGNIASLPYTSSLPVEVNMAWDIDDNGVLDKDTDGLLVVRYLAGFTGDALIKELIGVGAQRVNAGEITAYLDSFKAAGNLDADGNGNSDALSDGLLISRYMVGYIGESLISEAVAPDATRTSAEEIYNFIHNVAIPKGVSKLTCRDSDGGLNIFEKGTVKLGEEHEDLCRSYKMVWEDSCGSFSNPIKDKEYFFVNLRGEDILIQYDGADKVTDSNPKVQFEIVSPNSDDRQVSLDYDGSFHLKLNGRTLNFINVTSAQEKDFDIILSNMEFLIRKKIACPMTCSEGACVDDGTIDPKIYCTEEDGGINYYATGSYLYKYGFDAEGSWLGGSGVSEVCDGDGETLIEHYCDENRAMKTIEYKCPEGCIEGVCVGEEPEFVCTDSDEGKDYYVKGATEWGSSIIIDSCIEDRLDEGFCHEDGVGGSTLYECPKGCKDGACVEEETPPEELCEPIGLRKRGEYCSIGKVWLEQKEEDSFCENNFECESNLCIDDRCVSGSLWRRFLEWLKRLFG